VKTLPDRSDEDADTMLVLFSLLNSRSVSATGLAPLLQKPPDEVQTVLGRLAAAPFDLLEPTRETSRRSQPNYRLREAALRALGTAVTYRRRTADSIDTKVLDLLREAGSINARMVRLVLDTDTPTTSRILADLVERDLLVKTSTATRGPGVTYGPGPKFPSRSKKRSRKLQTEPGLTLFEDGKEP